MQLLEYQKKKLLADCYAFLKPDAAMIDKYIRSLDEARNSDEIETLKARISVMEDKEKIDFEKKISIVGWIMTLALAGFPYLLLGVGIEMIKMFFLRFLCCQLY